MADLIPHGSDFQSGQFKHLAPGDYLVDTTGAVISGWTGIQGITGTIGITGLLGIQGLTGISIFGATGVRGITGLIGLTGVQGLTGLIGSVGITGQVVIGSTGTIGQTGIQGVTGLTGNPGSQGLQGVSGLMGTTGIIGTTGLNPTGLAPIGTTGIQGVTGIQGSTGIGATGVGLQGVTGLRGTTGIQGITGINDYVILSTQHGITGNTLIYTIESGALESDNQQIDFSGFGVSATNGTPTTVNVTFGGTVVFTDSISASGGKGVAIEGTILRLSVASQQIIVAAVYEDGDSHVQRSTTTANLAADQELIFVLLSGGVGQTTLNLVVKKILE